MTITVADLPTRPGWFVGKKTGPGGTVVSRNRYGAWECEGSRLAAPEVAAYFNDQGGFYRLVTDIADEKPNDFDVSGYGLEWTPDRRHLLSELTGEEIPAEADRVQMRPNVLADLVLRVATSGRLTAEDTQALREAGVDITTEPWFRA